MRPLGWKRVFLAALLLTGALTGAVVFGLGRGSGHERAAVKRPRLTVTLHAPPNTPAWLLRLAARKARAVTESAPMSGVIRKRRLTYEVQLRGDFTWLACAPCPKQGPLPVAIRDSIVFDVDPEHRRLVMTSGPAFLMR